MAETISPQVDIAFKKIFGVEENKDLLISLINSIVSEEDQVAEITLLNPYNSKNFKTDKLSILDIKAKGVDGKRFNIEIQIATDANYDKRALYYWAKLYTEQLKNSEEFDSLSKAIGIHILNFTSIPGVKKYHNVFHITEKETGLLYFKDLELHTIELKKFSENSQANLADILAKIHKSLDMWVAFLTRRDLLNKEHLPSALNNPALKKALNVLDVLNFTDEEREMYEGHLKWLRTEASALKTTRDEGVAEGRLLGKAEGIEEGEEKKAREIAKRLLQQEMSLDLVCEITGLNEEVISELVEAFKKAPF